MANAYFCNGVPEKIIVNLNSSFDPLTPEPRKAQLDANTNTLHMCGFAIVDSRDKGKFSKSDANTVVITFESLRSDAVTYDIEVDASVAGEDLFFYVFQNTLVGQDQRGRTTGISIQAHETVKRRIQSGDEIPAARLNIPSFNFGSGDPK